MTNTLRTEAMALQGELVRVRREIHRRPEVGLALPRTQRTVLDAIDGLGLEISLGKSLSSVTAVLRGARRGRAVLLRADMDALPGTEESGLDYASEVRDAMHACGHDLHTAMLIGAARLLAAQRNALAGDVVFMFQSGEEGCDGAARMIDEGVLTAAGQQVGAAYGMHVQSHGLPRGVFGSRPGTLMAGVDGLAVTVRGAGGHGSMPHLARDPVAVAAELVTSLHTLVTRRFDVFDPVVITVGSFHGGTRSNTIPDTAHFEATVRTFSEPNRQRVRTEAIRLCTGLAQAHGLTAEVAYTPGYPVTVNDPERYEFASRVVSGVFGADRFVQLGRPVSASEDFSRVLERAPGCYLILGASAADDPASAPTNHSPRAVFDDSVLADGALAAAHLAIGTLSG